MVHKLSSSCFAFINCHCTSFYRVFQVNIRALVVGYRNCCRIDFVLLDNVLVSSSFRWQCLRSMASSNFHICPASLVVVIFSSCPITVLPSFSSRESVFLFRM